MASDEGPIVQSARLRSELVRLRLNADMTQEMVARSLDWSPIKLLRIEGGHTSIRTVDLDALLTRYDVTSGAERDRLQALNRAAREQGWWKEWQWLHRTSLAQLNYIGYETGATCIRQSPGAAVPELLQTFAYAEAHIAGLADAQLRILGTFDDPSRRVNDVAELRLQRQMELARRKAPLRQCYVLDEAVIRRHVGIGIDPTIMPDQLHHIADKAESNELVTVQVIPFKSGAHPGLAGPFILLEFDEDLPTRLYFEAGLEMIFRASGDAAREYEETFETLLKVALPAGESIQFIRQAAEGMT